MVGRENNLPCYMQQAESEPQNVQSVLLGTQGLVSQGKMVALVIPGGYGSSGHCGLCRRA